MTRAIPPVRRLLMDAKALIAKPENWCKGTYARSAKNNSVNVHSWRACKFCPSGALFHAAGTWDLYEHPAPRLLRESIGQPIISFNDAPTTTHPMIMRLFNKAIKRAKEQGI